MRRGGTRVVLYRLWLVFSVAFSVALVPSVALAGDDDDPWYTEASQSTSGPIGTTSSPLTSEEIDCAQPGTTRAIGCDPYPAAVGMQVNLTLNGFRRGESLNLRFYHERDDCGRGARCWTLEYVLPMTMDNNGSGWFPWDTTGEQPGAFRLCVNSIQSCQAKYVTDQLLPADTSTPGAYTPDTCQQGFVWREAFPHDHACVTPDVRTQAALDNSLASSRKSYGADSCLFGYVWRDAKPGDHVCVTPDVRAQAARDNSLAAARRQPGGGPYGADTCKQGFVWRDAFSNDHVCVTPDVRTQAGLDNSQAPARIDATAGPLLYGPDTCRQGFVWREAEALDHVCVTPDVRSQAAYDNRQAQYRVLP